jgi:hypothetical protein
MTTTVKTRINMGIADLMDGGDLSEGYLGFCTACGEEQGGCEPDARGYTCESCGAPLVYGAEELVLMGFGA